MQFLEQENVDFAKLLISLRSEPTAILKNRKPEIVFLPTKSMEIVWDSIEFEQLLIHAKHLQKLLSITSLASDNLVSSARFIDIKEVNIDYIFEHVRKEPIVLLKDTTPYIIALPAGGKEDNDWKTTEYGNVNLHAAYLRTSLEKEILPKVDPGIIEVSLALAGIAIALAVFLPEAEAELPSWLRLVVAILLTLVAFVSSFSGLWFLALYCIPTETLDDLSVMAKIIMRKELGPFWFKSIALLLLLILSVIVGVLSVILHL